MDYFADNNIFIHDNTLYSDMKKLSASLHQKLTVRDALC